MNSALGFGKVAPFCHIFLSFCQKFEFGMYVSICSEGRDLGGHLLELYLYWDIRGCGEFARS
jgi:hypothetical protein